MVSLTVGDVSGMIAAAVFILRLLPPLVFPLILAAFISDTNSVTAWSVLGRLFHSSYWPTILKTETAASSRVEKRIWFTSNLQTVALGLISIASIVTPLGLYDTIELASSKTTTSFSYFQDISAFGHGTPVRPDTPFTRICGEGVCPGASTNQNCSTTGLLTTCNATYDARIPIGLRNIFRDGATAFSPSVSSVFDIQWRTYLSINDTSQFPVGIFRPLSVLILDEDIQLVEGLIVDMKTGGIGFRNHTGPSSASIYGSTWQEDILFIEPETECVNLNWTIDFKVDYSHASFPIPNLMDPVITDRGGFSRLQRPAPSLETSRNGQGDLGLADRAYTAAWLNNFLTLAYFNETDADPGNITRMDVKDGQVFPLPPHSPLSFDAFQYIWTNMTYGWYLPFNQSNTTVNGVGQDEFLAITQMCAGSAYDSPASIDSSVVGCTLLYGAANRTDGGNSLIPDQGSQWSVPIHSCATALKGTVRTVSFQYNGTGLAALAVNSAVPKAYNNVSEVPRWAVENLGDFSINEAKPTWGLLGTSNSSDHPSSPSYNLSTVVAERLYLPGYMDNFYALLNAPQGTSDQIYNFPGVNFYQQALYSALNVAPIGSINFANQLPDYSGRTSLALFAKWQNMSLSLEGTAGIINLIWTDLAANVVVGTRGWGLNAASEADAKLFITNGSTTRDITPPSTTLVPITLYQTHIRYRIPYAVPAIVVLTIVLVVISILAVLLVLHRTGSQRMRRLLDATAAGRIMALMLWPKESDEDSKEWVRNVQDRKVTITMDGIFEEDRDSGPNAKPDATISSQDAKMNGTTVLTDVVTPPEEGQDSQLQEVKNKGKVNQ